ncbi:YbhB/YbcL family Raf kinase inhibitor-like protein [Mangrovicella endophytica]|uniref:YbhB/YbcL family Raf kinase inhibitor-like protein n=1 Tax=Mangrovicella endophytica TaxID=2066697 RepID=UPI000C9E300B|nr:YbhB/YbcL family Raf kinase inhibitor-like protein [Mangrovicella endophytica]
MRRSTLPLTALALGLIPAGPVLAQQGDGTRVDIPISINKPNKVGATSDRIAGLKAPEGFAVTPFASGLGNTRIIAVSDAGNVYVTRREEGDVLMLRDADGDGKADGAPVTVVARPQTHGIAIHGDKFYLVTVKEVFVADLKEDGTIGELKMLVGDLPDAGQHHNRVMAFGPDGMLYISVGSTCNTCNETNPENATILKMKPDGTQRSIFASGLRNTIGFDWDPATGELWGLDHGIDFLGDDDQPEELNNIRLGGQYGWPHVYADNKIYPQSTPVGGITKEQWKAASTPMTLGYTAHAAPMQMKFYGGSAFPADYRGDAFATMRGSWNRGEPSGYEIVHIDFKDGKPTTIEPFVTGFLTDGGKTHIARPVGLAVAKDGSLLMADDANGVIYRVAYTGDAQTADASNVSNASPAGPMEEQASKGVGVPLALQREETAEAKAEIKVTSSTVKGGAAIPMKHSDYADGLSPALSWEPVKNAVSYAIVMEDPDAKPTTPFVHWVAWNIPATLTELPEGLQEQPRLVEPEGLLQGRNSRGSTGYFGPKPPVGDPAHHYHFQVLALDTLLDIKPGSDRDTVLEAAKGHVIGKGELVGTYAQTAEPPKQ